MTEPIPALLDGALPLQRMELAALLRERARLAAMWFVPIQRADGAFPYSYDPARDHYDLLDYNEVRHAGVTYALFQACARFDDASLRACARRAAEWVLHSSVSAPGGGAVFLYGGRCKLGGLALAIVALLEGKRVLATGEYDDAVADLGTFLLGLELPEEPGRYWQSFDATTQEKLLTPASNYYPGEALLALVRLHRAFPDGPWLAAARRAAHYLTLVKDGDLIAAGVAPRDDHWLTIALSELARADSNPDYATVAFLHAERMVRNQYQAGDLEPWRIGAGRRNPTPSFPSTATQAEALHAAWDLAMRLGNADDAGRYAQAALRAAQFLLRVQHTGASRTAFSHPERAAGAWSQDRNRSQIRIDFVQHGLSALIGAIDLLEAPADRSEPIAPLEIVESRFLGRHNQWSVQPVLRLTIRNERDTFSDSRIQAVTERFELELGRLPDVPTGVAPIVEPDGSAGDPIGGLIGRAVLDMQRALGDQLTFVTVWPGGTPGIGEIAVAYRYDAVAMASAELAISLIRTMLDPPGRRFDFLREFEKRVAAKHPSRACRPDVVSVLAAADRRGIPIRAVDIERELVALGTGAYGRRFWNLSTSNTAAHGVRFAKDKLLASRLLRDAGLPVPRSALVRSLDEAKRAALDIGYPVVLKPNLGSQGRDVFVEIRNEDELSEIGQAVMGGRASGDWLVEEFIAGREHRVLVIGGVVTAVNLRLPPEVTGDGISTVRELIDALNADPRRSLQKGFALKPVVPGAQHLATLRRQDLTLDSVPDAGRVARLTSVSNVSAGGSTRDVTDSIHADNARIACMAAAAVGLDIAGVDLVVPDIGRSFRETGGAIVEINSNPGMIDHLQPGSGTPRDVGGAIVDLLYPVRQPVRARIVVVVESGASTAICRSLGQMLTDAGWMVGVASQDGLAIGGLMLRGGDARHPHGISTLLAHPAVEIGVVEIGAADILEHGLGFDACDAFVLSEADDGIDRPGQRSVATVLRAALDTGGDAEPDGALLAIRQVVRMFA